MGLWRVNCLACLVQWVMGGAMERVHGESLCLPRERIEVSNQTSSFLEQWRKSAVPNLVLRDGADILLSQNVHKCH